jgi:hypothetical protein
MQKIYGVTHHIPWCNFQNTKSTQNDTIEEGNSTYYTARV